MNRPALLRKLTAAKIEVIDLSGRGRSLEVTIHDKDVEKFRELIAPWGGYRCGTGNWVLRDGYTSDKDDWNDRSSAWHY